MGGMEIKTYLDHEAILAGQSMPVHLALRFTAPELRHQRGKPIALCLVLDRSGSMAGEPLEGAKEAAKLVARNLDKDDMLSIVVFDAEAQTVFPLQPVSNLAATEKIIDDIVDCGSTNLTSGWMLGRDQLSDAPEGMMRRLVLLSDGHLNVGIVDPQQVNTIVCDGLERAQIRTTCLGFGDGYDEDLLSTLASETGGGYYDATEPESLPGIFEAELDGLQKVTVQNLRIRFEHLMFCEGAMLLSAYPWNDLPDGRVELTVGDLVSEEQRIVILALDVAAIPPLPKELGEASLEGEDLMGLEILWDEINADGIASKRFEQVVRITAVQDEGQLRVNKEIIPWVAAQRAGRSVKLAIEESDAGRLDEARAHLQRTLKRIEELGNNGDVTDAVKLLKDTLSKMQREDDFDLRERKNARFRSRDHMVMSSASLYNCKEDMPSYKAMREFEREEREREQEAQDAGDDEEPEEK